MPRDGRPLSPPVIACVDGSQHSEPVCEYGAWLGRRHGAIVEVLHLVDGLVRPADPLASAAELERYIHARGERLMYAAADWIIGAGGELGDLKVGLAPLVEAAGRLSDAAGALVIGQRGQSSPPHSLRLGDNVLRILARSAAPVCLAPTESRPIARVLALFNTAFPDEALTRFVTIDPSLDGLECRLVGYGDVRAGRPGARGPTPSAAIEAARAEADFDLLVLPRAALVADPHRRELEGLITALDRPVMLPAQGGLARLLFEARGAAALSSGPT